MRPSNMCLSKKENPFALARSIYLKISDPYKNIGYAYFGISTPLRLLDELGNLSDT